jgi:hypothetical protein
MVGRSRRGAADYRRPAALRASSPHLTSILVRPFFAEEHFYEEHFSK